MSHSGLFPGAQGSFGYGNNRQLTKLCFQSVRDGIQNVWFQVGVLNWKRKTKIILCIKKKGGLFAGGLGVLAQHRLKFLVLYSFVCSFYPACMNLGVETLTQKDALRGWSDSSASTGLATQPRDLSLIHGTHKINPKWAWCTCLKF